MPSKQCEVCHDAESKYKCPHCELRYCSLACFKLHKVLHESPSQDVATSSTTVTNQAGDAPTTAATVEHNRPSKPAENVNPYMALQSHPRFQPLFTKYPRLKSQLHRVHQATLNPYQPPLDGGPRPRIRDRVPGQWTQDKADELAAKVLVDLGKQDEGVKEFMALVGEVFGTKGKEVDQEEKDG